MQKSKPLAGLIIFMMLTGCATRQVSVDYDPAANLSALRTYDWAAIPQEKAGDPLIDTDTLLRQRVVSALDGELARRRFIRTHRKPGFLVTFFFTRERKVGGAGYPYTPFYGGFFGGPYYGYWGGWYYPGYYGYGMYPREYDEGLLVIDFIDPASRKLLWRGMVRDYFRFQETPESRDLRINKAVPQRWSDFRHIERSGCSNTRTRLPSFGIMLPVVTTSGSRCGVSRANNSAPRDTHTWPRSTRS